MNNLFIYSSTRAPLIKYTGHERSTPPARAPHFWLEFSSIEIIPKIIKKCFKNARTKYKISNSNT